MIEGPNRHFAERRLYSGLSVLAGTATVLGLLGTVGLICGVGLNLLENSSSSQTPGTLSPDIIPTQLACGGASALFTIASGIAWVNLWDKADRAGERYRNSLPPEPSEPSGGWW